MTVVQAVPAHAEGAAGVTVNISSTGSGNLLLIAAVMTNNSSTLSLSYGGTSQTATALQHPTGASDQLQAWYVPNCASGTTSVTITRNSGTGQFAALVVEVSGIVTSSPLDVSTSSGSQAANSTLSTGTTGTTAQASEFWWAVFADKSVGTGGTAPTYSTLSSGWTADVTAGSTATGASTNVSIYDATQTASATGTANATLAASSSASTNEGNGVVATFKIASGGGTTPSGSDSAALTDTANNIGLTGPTDTGTVVEGPIGIGLASSDSGTVAEGPVGIGLSGSDSGSVGDALSTDYPTAVLQDAPVRWWRLNEGSGTKAKDASGSSHDATYAGGVTLGRPGLLQADPATSALFDGTTGHASANTPTLSTGTTLEAWIEASSWTPSTAFSTQTVFYLSDPGTWLAVRSTGAVMFACYTSGSGQVQLNTSALLSLSTPHHIVGTFDGQHVLVYIDGQLAASQAVASTTLNSFNNNGDIATNSGGGVYFGGQIQDVALYDHALSPTRILAHYQARTTVVASTSAADNGTLTEGPSGVGLGQSDTVGSSEAAAIALLHQDVATFSEQVAVAVTAAATDSSTVTETTSGTATVSATDVGAEGETASQSSTGATPSSSDSGTLSDTPSIGSSGSSSDASGLAEQIQIALAHQDNANLGEAMAIALAHQDSAALRELVGIALGTADNAAFAEQVAITVKTADSDSASLSESASKVQTGSNPADSDSASMAEQIALALQATDGAGLAESMAIAMARSDTTTLGELVQVALAIADVAAATESAGVGAATSSGEQAGVSESASIAATITATELGTLAEQASAGQVSLASSSDGATLAEQVKNALLAGPEGAAIIEQFQVAVSGSTVDVAAIQEAVHLAIALVVQDTAAFGETASVTATGISLIAFKTFVVQARTVTFVVQARAFTFTAQPRVLITFVVRSP